MIASTIVITPALAVFGTIFLISSIIFIRIILCRKDGRDFLRKLFKAFY